MKSFISGNTLRNIILGGQDGLVNVLGIVLGVGAATQDAKLILLTGLVATAAESVSMAAVAYTSSKAEKEFDKSVRDKHGKTLHPLHEAVVVGGSSVIGSLIPLVPFVFLNVMPAMIIAVIFCAIVLFCAGVFKARLTKTPQMRSGIELVVIGLLAALAGYIIGAIVNVD
ncbi:MAG: VIT1/CCC1 transporter family protein [Candidatus Woesearchaeota archaeon]|nr:VIT1/CCC1 transporter family protein [Candidatus Woesearchaeota archaeon]